MCSLSEKTPNVRLIGLVSEGEKAFLLKRAQAFILPSLMEGIGLAAVEATFVGTTVVITKKGGPARLLRRPGVLCISPLHRRHPKQGQSSRGYATGRFDANSKDVFPGANWKRVGSLLPNGC